MVISVRSGATKHSTGSPGNQSIIVIILFYFIFYTFRHQIHSSLLTRNGIWLLFLDIIVVSTAASAIVIVVVKIPLYSWKFLVKSDKEFTSFYLFKLIVSQIKAIAGSKKMLINTCLACDSIPLFIFFL